MHIAQYDQMAAFASEFLTPYRGQLRTILDVGSYDVNGTHKPIFNDPMWKYVGMDMAAGPNVDLLLEEAYNWKEVPTNSFDVVVSGSLLEHVEYPWMTMIEVARVLKPGGLTCHVAPSAGFEHRFPVDCYRYYKDGFAALANWADLEILKVFTDWGSIHRGSRDGGHVWNESVLIARKKNTNESILRAAHMETLLKSMNSVIK